MTARQDRQEIPGQRTEPTRPSPDLVLHSLFGRSTAVFASLAGPAHCLEAANPAFLDAVGGRDRARLGMPLAELLPELVDQGFTALLDRVYRTGEPYVGRDERVLLGPPENRREAFFDFTYEPRRDDGGDVVGVRVLGVETTRVKHAQRLAAEQRALLEQIARQAPLEQVLDGVARVIEELCPGVIASVLLADEDGRRLRHGAAPGLPDFYNEAIDGIAIGEGVGSCGTAAHRRRMVIVGDIAAHPFWADFRDLAERASLAACWSTPVLAADGLLLGTFAMYHRTPRTPGESDLALCRLFADTAALAIERHRQERARREVEAREQAARDDLAFLLEAGTALAERLDLEGTLQRVAELCVPALAPLCAVDVLEHGGIRRAATAASTPAQQRLLAAHPPAHGAADDPVARVVASGLTEVARRPPAGPGPWAELGVTGYLCVPLADRGRVFATVTLFGTGEHAFDGHGVALAEELARRAAAAARNAQQYSQRVELARDLQAGLLLPDLPDVPGAELAAHYHPAGEGLGVGGDFYDVFRLPGGDWAFLVGDVCGRGARAAGSTALVRHTARAAARLVPDPVLVVRAVNTALLERPDSHGTGFVTLVYGHLRRTGAGLGVDLVRAGHTTPLLLDGDRRVDRVRADGTLLGVFPDDELGLEPRRLHLAPGQSLLLVTDGITEARDASGDQFGEERLAEALARGDRPASARAVLEAVVDAVRAFTGGGDADDDQAALVLTATDR